MFGLLYALTAAMAGQFVAWVFLLAGIAKLLSPAKTVAAIQAYLNVPSPAARFLAIVLPWCEIVLALSLLVGLAAPYSSIGAVLLLVLFSTAQVSALLRGKDMNCGCFGTLSTRRLSWMNVIANVVLIATSSAFVAAVFCNVIGFSWNGTELPAHTLTITPIRGLEMQAVTLIVFVQWLAGNQIITNRRYEHEYWQERRAHTSAAAIKRLHQQPQL